MIRDEHTRRLRAVRRARQPDLADGRVRARRAHRQPARDVRGRPAHDPVEPRRPAGPVDPVRPLGGAPRRAAADRPPVRREPALPRRPRARARARVRLRPGEATDELGAGHRPGDPRPSEDADEDVLPLPGRVLRDAQLPDVPGLPGAPRLAAGPEPRGDRADDAARARARLRDRSARDLPPQELLLPGQSQGLPDLPVRRAALRERLRAACPGPRATSRSGSCAPTSRRTRRRRSTSAGPRAGSTAPRARSSTSTGPERRSSRS